MSRSLVEDPARSGGTRAVGRHAIGVVRSNSTGNGLIGRSPKGCNYSEDVAVAVGIEADRHESVWASGEMSDSRDAIER